MEFATTQVEGGEKGMSESIKELNEPTVRKIKEVIAAKGIQKRFLAAEVGIPDNVLSSILHGRKLLTASMIQRISDALDVDAGELFVRQRKAPPEEGRAIYIGSREYQRITIAGKSNEVLAVITNDSVVEKAGIRCIFED